MKRTMRLRLYILALLGVLYSHSNAVFFSEEIKTSVKEIEYIKSLIIDDHNIIECLANENEKINEILKKYFSEKKVILKNTFFDQKTIIESNNTKLKGFQFVFSIPEQPVNVSDTDYIKALKKISKYRSKLRTIIVIINADLIFNKNICTENI